ncbi:MAG: hypothetical protein JWO43_99 [Candidatus Adlerbacteria bacterium]|nr:hypothetical protein [Candidatus Adlerbacteria bacterium]
MRGKIFQISTLDQLRTGEPHHPQKDEAGDAIIGRWGLEGDCHNREMRRSFSKPGTFKPNIDRHITLLAIEVIDSLNQELGLEMRPGTLGENITTQGLGDLFNIADGSRIFIRNPAGSELCVLRVTEQNEPCINLSTIHRLLVKRIYKRRGLLCSIVSGIGNRIMSGDPIEVIAWSATRQSPD